MRLNARGKRFFGNIKKKAHNLDTAVKRYRAEALQRRAAEIAKLQDDIKLEKLKAQKRKLLAANRPASANNFDPFRGFQ